MIQPDFVVRSKDRQPLFSSDHYFFAAGLAFGDFFALAFGDLAGFLVVLAVFEVLAAIIHRSFGRISSAILWEILLSLRGTQQEKQLRVATLQDGV